MLNEDVGAWLKDKITEHFKHDRYKKDPHFTGRMAKCFYVDPTYKVFFSTTGPPPHGPARAHIMECTRM